MTRPIETFRSLMNSPPASARRRARRNGGRAAWPLLIEALEDRISPDTALYAGGLEFLAKGTNPWSLSNKNASAQTTAAVLISLQGLTTTELEAPYGLTLTATGIDLTSSGNSSTTSAAVTLGNSNVSATSPLLEVYGGSPIVSGPQQSFTASSDDLTSSSASGISSQIQIDGFTMSITGLDLTSTLPLDATGSFNVEGIPITLPSKSYVSLGTGKPTITTAFSATLSTNPTVTIGSASFSLGTGSSSSNSVTVGYDPSAGVQGFYVDGSATFDYDTSGGGGDNLTVTLGDATQDGLVFTSKGLTSAYASISGSFSVGPLTIAATSLALGYSSGTYQITGGGSLTVGSGDTIQSVSVTLPSPGLQITNGSLTGLDAQLDGTLHIGGLTASAQALQVVYVPSTSELQISGALELDLTDKIKVSTSIGIPANNQPSLPLTINATTGAVDLTDGFDIGIGVDIGDFDLSGSVSFSEATGGGYDIDSDLQIKTPGDIEFDATLDIADGQLVDIGIGLSADLAVGDTGLYITWVYGALQGINTDDPTISAAATLEYGQPVGGVPAILVVTGAIQINEQQLFLSADPNNPPSIYTSGMVSASDHPLGIEIEGGVLGQFGGTVDLDWASGVYEVSADGSLLDDLATFDFQMYLSSGGDLSFSADVGINIPSFIPVIGGMNLASGHVRFEYMAGAPSSQDYVAAWASIPILGTAGVEYTFNGKFSFLNGADVSNLLNQGKAVSPYVAYNTQQITVGANQGSLQYTISDPLLDENIYAPGSAQYTDAVDYQQTNWVQITDPNGNIYYGNLASSVTNTDFPTNEIYSLYKTQFGLVIQPTVPTVDPLSGSSAPTARIFSFNEASSPYVTPGVWTFSLIDFNNSNANNTTQYYLLPANLLISSTTTPAAPAFIQKLGGGAPWTAAAPNVTQDLLTSLTVGAPMVVYNNTKGSTFTVSVYATTSPLNPSDDLTTPGSDPASNGNGALVYQEVDTFSANDPDGSEFHNLLATVPYSALPVTPNGVTGLYFYVVVNDGLNAPVRSGASAEFIPLDPNPQIVAPSVEVVAPGQALEFTALSTGPSKVFIAAPDPGFDSSDTVTIASGDDSLSWVGNGLYLQNAELTGSGLKYTSPTTPGVDTITITQTFTGPGTWSSTEAHVIEIVPPNNVDLSVSQDVIGPQNSVIASTDGEAVGGSVPSAGLPVTFHLTVTASATIASTASTANGATVQYAIPSDINYSSYSASQGGYNPTTGIWTIGSIAEGSSVTLNVYGKVGSGPLGDAILSAATVVPGTNSDGTPQVDTDPANNSSILTLAAALPISGVVYLADYTGGATNSLNPRIPNLTVELIDLRPVGGGKSKIIATTTTDANGLYNFASTGSGQYQVAILATSTAAIPLTQYNVDLTQIPYSFSTFGVTPTIIKGQVLMAYGNASANLPASAFSPAAGELVYVDLNNDGQFDPGDPSTVTNTNGNYSLTGLMPGIYTVRIYLGPGRAAVGAASITVNSNPTGGAAPSSFTLRTFEFADERTVSGYFFIDTNGDQIDDSGEPGVYGLPIALEQVSSTGAALNSLGIATTDPSGMYYFQGTLAPGYYEVYVNGISSQYIPDHADLALRFEYFEVNANGTIATLPDGLGGPTGTVLDQNWISNIDFAYQYRVSASVPSPGDDSLVISDVPPVTAGQLTQFTVTAENNGQVDPDYTGTIDLATTDPNGYITGSYTFTAADRGVHTFNVQFMTTGQWAINIEDTVDAAYTSASEPMTVSTGQASQCVVEVPKAVTAGQSFDLSLHPVDSAGNAAVTYWGTADITVSLEAGDDVLDNASLPPDLAAWIESGAGLPSTYHFTFEDNGTHAFTLQAPTLSAADLADLAAMGVTAATPLNLVVNVTDPQGIVAVGNVAIAIMPVATARTLAPTAAPPEPTIDVRLQGSTQAIAGVPIHLTLTASAIAGRSDAASPHTIEFTTTDPNAILPSDVTVTAGSSGLTEVAVTFGNAGTYVVMAIDTADGAIVGQETVSVLPAQARPSARVVDAVFEVLVGQPADAAELSQWSTALAKGASASNLVTAITHSASYIDPEVDAIYESLLDRPPTVVELRSATTQVRHGGSIQAVEVSVLGSRAFDRLRGGRRADFLSSVAEAFLGRRFSAKEQRTYSARLAHGATRKSVAAAVLDTPAAARVEAKSLYEALLFREPTRHELARLTPTLKTEQGRATAIARIVDTPAFRELAGDPVIQVQLAGSTEHFVAPSHATPHFRKSARA